MAGFTDLARNGASLAALIGAIVSLTGCESARVKTFTDHAKASCECSDADCAKTVHTEFLASWSDLQVEKVDWGSSEGKKDKKAIENAIADYRKCLGKNISDADATEVCQEEPEGKKNADGCKACCTEQGRFFKAWVDPMAAGIAGALGAGDIKGCSCS